MSDFDGFTIQLLIDDDGDWIAHFVEPVSYTHLDVYKRQAMRHKQDKGEYIGGETPYGFKLIDGELFEDDVEQEVIQKAKDFHTAGLSLRKIAAELDKQGIKTRRNSLFAATQIQRMIA